MYTGSKTEQLMLVEWWMRLIETSDIDLLSHKHEQSIESFLSLFNSPTALLYSTYSPTQPNQSRPITIAAWFKPILPYEKDHSAFGSLWIDKTIRRTQTAASIMELFYSVAFEYHDAIFGVTWQPKILELHKKIGYNIVGHVPGLNDHEHNYFVHLTKENFFNSPWMAQRKK